MREHGHPDITIPPSLVGAVPPVPENHRRYGVVDERNARQFGYHLPPDPGSDSRAAELDAWLAGLTDREKSALYGTTSSGCLADAIAALSHGAVETNTRWFTNLDFTSLNQSERTPAVAAAVATWRVCMSQYGRDYADPYAAAGDPQWNLDSPYISDREIGTAAADVRCKTRVDLVRIWVVAETEMQLNYIHHNANRFAQLAQARLATYTNAVRILNEAAAS
jgi:hypothetical protein